MNTNKKYLVWGLIFVVGFVVGVFIKPGAFFAPEDKELSYKTDKLEPRYLKSFKRATTYYPEDTSDLVAGSQAKIQEIERLFNEAGNLAKQFSWFSGIQDEHAFIYMIDLGNARLTVDIGGGEYSIKKGFDTSKDPTLVVPLTERGLRNMVNVLRDGELTYEEQYMIYNALAIPGLQALYQTNPLYLPGDKSIFKFDDLVHVVIPPEKPVLYFGVPLNIEMTAANVDGQWMVFSGLHGDPDFKLSMNLEQTTRLYQTGIYEVRNLNTPAEAIDLSKRFLKFLEETLVYVRNDHK